MSRVGKRIPPYLGMQDLADLLHGRAIHYILPLESLDGIGTSTSGSGSIGLGTDGLALITGTTAGSVATADKPLYKPAGNLFNYKLRALFMGQTYNGESNLTAYMVVGDVPNLSRYVGFKIHTDGKLYGCVYEAGSETTVDLDYTVGTGWPHPLPVLEVRFYPAVKAEFYIDGAKRGEITSGLPSGTPSYYRILSLRVENADATNRGIGLGYYSLFRWLV